jgi:hypothetical protein
MRSLWRVQQHQAAAPPLRLRARLFALVVIPLAAAPIAGACATPQPAPPAPAPSVATVAEAATAAYSEFWRISKLAFASPTEQDWQAELSKVARGQALNDVVLEIRNYASVPAHLEGVITNAPIVDPAVAPAPSRVTVLDCVDISGSRLVSDVDGTVLDDEANQVPRYHYRAVVVQAEDGRWLVESTEPLLDQPC